MRQVRSAIFGLALIVGLMASAYAEAKSCCTGASCCAGQACCHKAKSKK